jgi:hypothetical protein
MHMRTFILAGIALIGSGISSAISGPCAVEIDGLTKTLASKDAGSGPTVGATGQANAPTGSPVGLIHLVAPAGCSGRSLLRSSRAGPGFGDERLPEKSRDRKGIAYYEIAPDVGRAQGLHRIGTQTRDGAVSIHSVVHRSWFQQKESLGRRSELQALLVLPSLVLSKEGV